MKMFLFANCQIGNFAKASGHHPFPAALFMVDQKNPVNHPTPIKNNHNSNKNKDNNNLRRNREELLCMYATARTRRHLRRRQTK